jgi:hypothetical protein
LTGLFLVGHLPNGVAQEVTCLTEVKASVFPAVWSKITEYFESLSLASAQDKSQLTRLREQIVLYETGKQRLIDIVQAHIGGGTSGVAVARQLASSEIPEVLDQIDRITRRLRQMANEGNLFAAEDAFKQLIINFDLKRASVLCGLAQSAASSPPDVSAMSTLLQQLKDELMAISKADEALGKYIKDSSK